MIIIGNLTRDPESRTTNSGKEVCSFTVAVNRRQKVENQPEADFFRVSAWGKTGESCQKYLTKGRKVCVTGQVSVHAYQDKNGNPAGSLEVFAEDVEFLSPKGEGGTGEATQAEPSADPSGATVVDTDELPF